MAKIRLSRSFMYHGLPTDRWVVRLRLNWLQTDRSSVALDTTPMLNLNATHELCVVGDLWPDRILLQSLCDVAIHCCTWCELYNSRYESSSAASILKVSRGIEQGRYYAPQMRFTQVQLRCIILRSYRKLLEASGVPKNLGVGRKRSFKVINVVGVDIKPD